MDINTSSAISNKEFQLSGRKYQIVTPDASLWKPATADQIAWDKSEALKQKEVENNFKSQIATYNAVKVHTVIRVGGDVAAVVYRDGTSEYYKNESFVGLDTIEYANRLPGPQKRDYIVNAIMKKLSRTAVEERYGEVGWAPDRGMIRKEVDE